MSLDIAFAFNNAAVSDCVVELECERPEKRRKVIHTSKVILSANSEVFRRMFDGPMQMKEALENTVSFSFETENQCEKAEKLLKFMYKRDLDFEKYTDVDLLDFLEVAQAWDLSAVVKLIIDALKRKGILTINGCNRIADTQCSSGIPEEMIITFRKMIGRFLLDQFDFDQSFFETSAEILFRMNRTCLIILCHTIAASLGTMAYQKDNSWFITTFNRKDTSLDSMIGWIIEWTKRNDEIGSLLEFLQILPVMMVSKSTLLALNLFLVEQQLHLEDPRYERFIKSVTLYLGIKKFSAEQLRVLLASSHLGEKKFLDWQESDHSWPQWCLAKNRKGTFTASSGDDKNIHTMGRNIHFHFKADSKGILLGITASIIGGIIVSAPFNIILSDADFKYLFSLKTSNVHSICTRDKDEVFKNRSMSWTTIV